ncbi:Class E basic helix-loop-helix protein 23 [Trachymyrmex cornetzi]|uniref:Class E basic helix-loop-helix protein 23 n=1 Tax=Trachymyrmex cornetzi TaxID=471704 RepID=A0A151J8G7_9HYME|nr:Class E basic helix-loop-helix protein 23 [Trachymyrmex cornetzi]
MRSYDGESSSTEDDDRREGLPEPHLQQGSWQRTASHPTWAWEHRNAHPLPPQSAAALESVYSTPGASHPGVSGPPAAYSSEHTQSAPGRRTPLGTVGLGGFYFQQQPQPHASSSALSDENRPDERKTARDKNHLFSSHKVLRIFSEFIINFLVLHFLIFTNVRKYGSVIPYAHSPSVRKLSKIATLLLAKNYILMQGNALEELRRVIAVLQSPHAHTTALPPTPVSYDLLQGFPGKLFQGVQEMQGLPASEPQIVTGPPTDGTVASGESN